MEARNLIQQLLPADCKPLVIAEIKDGLQIKTKNRLEYDVLHEILQSFALSGAMQGLDRHQNLYYLSLTNLTGIQVRMALRQAELQAEAERLLREGMQRELNALLKQAEKALPAEQYAVLAAAVEAADTLQTLLPLYAVLPQINLCIKETNHFTETLTRTLYGKPLVPESALNPLKSRLEDLQAELTCCWILTNVLKKIEYDAIMSLIQRLERPFIGHTVKDVTAMTRKKMRLTDRVYPTHLATLLDDLETVKQPAEEKKAEAAETPLPTETHPLLANKIVSKPPSYDSRPRARW